jgi:hypothetical protein
MSLINDLLEKPPTLSAVSKYTAMNGVAYLAVGVLLIAWPGVTQTLFMDPAFVGHEEALFRVIGLTVWLSAGSTCSVVVRAHDNSLPLP